MNVVNLITDLKEEYNSDRRLNKCAAFLKANNANYQLNLNRVILTGFSAGAHIASYVGISANNPNYMKTN
jgi:predicted esterase